MRAKLNRALAQIVRNKELDGQSTIKRQHDKPGSKEAERTREKKSTATNDSTDQISDRIC